MDIEYTEEQETHITDAQLRVAHNVVEYRELDILEVDDYCKDEKLITDYGRTPGSFWFTLIRMHILVHGIMPLNKEYNANWFSVPKTMIDFCNRHGYDTEYNIDTAEREAQSRPKKRKRDVAVKVMSDHYRVNKSSYCPEIVKHRDRVIAMLMTGIPPEVAFEQINQTITETA